MDLKEFLAESELTHYLTALRNELKVTCVEHLKYVKEEDLEGIGMTRPEMRRLKKFYKKEHPQGTFGKLKRAILRTGGGGGETGRPASPPPSDHRISRPVSLLRPPGKTLIPSSSVAVGKALGEGHFGSVRHAVWTAESGEKVQVAVKCLAREKVCLRPEDVVREAAVFQTVDHENIVRLYGVVTDADGSIMLVTELAPMRSLLECLKEGAAHVDFPLPRLCDFAQQVCDAMSYLESKRLVHRQLAARNILVFSKSKVKISDAGLSEMVGAGKEYYLGPHLPSPAAWCPPEVLRHLHFTWASDVWALGVALWEMFTYGVQPWAGLTPQQIAQTVDEPHRQRLQQPDLCPKEFYGLMLKCWQHDPDRRPSFSQLFLTLPQIRPVQVKAVKDSPAPPPAEKGYLPYSSYDIIIVLDKSPREAPSAGLWRGCVASGRSGFFNPVNTVPYLEPKTSPISLLKTSLSRKESGRSSKRSKLRAEMIGAPQNDLRHTGHIGYDGAVFGDVSFIGDNYDKLPLKVGTSGKVEVSRGSSLSSIPRNTDSPDRNGFVKTSTSDDSLDKRNTYGHSWISQESLASTQADDHGDSLFDMEDNSIFADFKMPDLTSSFDLGPSFMDEVLKALDEKEKQAEAAMAPATFNGCDFGDDIDPNRVDLDKTPLAEEKTPTFEQKGFPSSPSSSFSSSAPLKQRASPLPSLPSLHACGMTMTLVLCLTLSSGMTMTLLLCLTLSSGMTMTLLLCLTLSSGDTPREKKQAKVKPMSASEERMMEDAITLANEVTATRAQRHSQSQSPPQSPTTSEKAAMDFSDAVLDPSPSLMCKLKNSIRRSPKGERKRTFSDDRPPKGDDVPPGAQEAYNALVVRGSERQDAGVEERVSVPSDAALSWDSVEGGGHSGADLRLPFCSAAAPPKAYKSGMPQPPPRPMPKPRLDPKKSDLPVPKPRPEIIQRVEPIRRPPDSPEVPLKEKDSSQIPLPASRKESWSESKEREREQLKKTIEIVRVESPARDELPTAGPELDTKESTPEPDSDSTHRSSASESGGDPNPKVLSLFDDDFSEPSPREIMSKLARESRMRRTMDHQRVLSGENQDCQAPPAAAAAAASSSSVTRTRREPSGIPAKPTAAAAAPPPADEGGKEEEEVDTNPLRMLRGGAIPIRTSRGAGNSSSGKSASSTLHYPKFGFHSVVGGGGGGGGGSGVCGEVGGGGGEEKGGGGPAPAPAPPRLPPRSHSVSSEREVTPPTTTATHHTHTHTHTHTHSASQEPRDPVPTVPPRTPLRQLSMPALNTRPRERRHPLMYSKTYSASFHASSSSSSPLLLPPTSPTASPSLPHPHPHPPFLPSVSLHDEPCPPDLPPAPARPRPHPLTLAMQTNVVPNTGASLSVRSDLDSHQYYRVDESVLEPSSSSSSFSSVFPSSRRRPLPQAPPSPNGAPAGPGGGCERKFAPDSVKCSLEQLGFYNQHDPFWGQTVMLPPDKAPALDSTASSGEEVSPLLVVRYKNSDNVSYEDLLDFGLDR
ncbi:hypothetical protein ACOMHN_009355 [Nucella lapillus]